MRIKEVNKKRKFTKEYGVGSAYLIRLYEAAGIEGSKHAMIADSSFGGIICVLGMYNLGYNLSQ